jgi:hypothetical protein
MTIERRRHSRSLEPRWGRFSELALLGSMHLVAADPEETRNVVAAHPALGEELRALLPTARAATR